MGETWTPPQGDMPVTAKPWTPPAGDMLAQSQTAQNGPKPFAVTKDGGTIYRMSDGSLAYAGQGYSTTDQAKIAELMRGATAAETSSAGFDEATIAQHPVAALGIKAMEGVPFARGYIDEAAGAMFGPKAAQGVQAASAAMQRQHPNQSLALGVAGGVASAIPVAIAAAPAAMGSAMTTGAQALRGLITGGAFGAAEGAVAGAGQAEGAGRGANALTGAEFGAMAGGALGAAAPFFGKGLAAVWNNLRGKPEAAIGSALGISPEAARVVKSALDAGDTRGALAAIQRAGDNAMLADAGQPAKQLLDAAAQTGFQAGDQVTGAVTARARQSSRELNTVLDVTFGKPALGPDALKAGIRAETAADRSATYRAAYDSAVDYSTKPQPPAAGATGPLLPDGTPRLPAPTGTALAPYKGKPLAIGPMDPQASRTYEEAMSPAFAKTPDYKATGGQKILDLLKRVPQSAIDYANKLMHIEGVSSKQIMASVADDGTVTYSTMPDVRQLDYITRALNNVAEAENSTGKLGGQTDLGRAYKNLSGSIRDTLRGMVPEYDTALSTAADAISRVKAVDLGYEMLRDGTRRETVMAGLKGATPAERTAAREGVRSYIDDTLANVRRTIADPTTDIREALKLVSALSSRAAKDKIAMLIGSDAAKRVAAAIEKEAMALELRGAVAQGSQTAIRSSIQGAVKAQTSPGVLELLASGSPQRAGQRFVQIFTGRSDEAQALRDQGIYTEIARALTTIRGADAQVALKFVQRAMTGGAITARQAERIGGIVSRGLLPAMEPTTSNAMKPR